jgi:hypothetical protein
MRAAIIAYGLLLAITLLAGASVSAAQQKKDYLSVVEADKIRNAESSAQRIKLFLSFAADRIKKLQYELSRPAGEDRNRAGRLNGLLNAYIGCVDDAANLIDLGLDKQEDIRGGIKEMQAKAKEFLTYLEELAKNGPELASYKQNLDDAIEGTREALQDAEKAAKQIAPPPARRKP